MGTAATVGCVGCRVPPVVVGETVDAVGLVCVGCRVPPVVVGETVDTVGDELGQISVPSIFVQKSVVEQNPYPSLHPSVGGSVIPGVVRCGRHEP